MLRSPSRNLTLAHTSIRISWLHTSDVKVRVSTPDASSAGLSSLHSNLRALRRHAGQPPLKFAPPVPSCLLDCTIKETHVNKVVYLMRSLCVGFKTRKKKKKLPFWGWGYLLLFTKQDVGFLERCAPSVQKLQGALRWVFSSWLF